MRLRSLEDLFAEQLKDIYYAEKQITKALPRMAKKAHDTELAQAFEDHLEETESQIERLEKVFEIIGKKPQAKKCEAMDGIIKEGKELMSEDIHEAVLDAGLIVAAQKVEHYEMAAYGSLRTFAERLGYEEAADLLQKNLDEEGAADERLTDIAESSVNEEAAEEVELEEGT